MHNFSELIQNSVTFNLKALESVQENVVSAFQTSASTSLVKTLQMVQLQKAITVVGMFSMFEAILQDELQCADGFQQATRLLEVQGASALKERFVDLQLAINVLKHGRGRSYDVLIQKAKAVALPFRVKLPSEHFFNEGDIAEVSTLIEVDNAFVLLCVDVIREVSLIIKSAN